MFHDAPRRGYGAVYWIHSHFQILRWAHEEEKVRDLCDYLFGTAIPFTLQTINKAKMRNLEHVDEEEPEEDGKSVFISNVITQKLALGEGSSQANLVSSMIINTGI